MSKLVLAVKARIYREGLVRALALRQDLVVCAATADAGAALEALQLHRPEIVLADIGLDGALSLVTAARAMSPATRLIALAVNADDNECELLKWAEAGAVGFVSCDNSLDELVACIDAAMSGELACSPRVSAVLLRRVCELAATDRAQSTVAATHLTPRQNQVLQMLNAGLSNKQIARELGIELATVKNHVHYLLKRLQVHRRHEAASALPTQLPSLAR